MDQPTFAEGDSLLLLDRAGNRRLIRLRAGRRADGHRGYIDHDELIGLSEGSIVRTSKGTAYVAVRPRLMEYVLEMPRGTAIVYPKDYAAILVWGDIFPGARVVESGLGSAALTMALLRAVGPTGQITVYESRPEHIPQAAANLRFFAGSPDNLTIKEADIYEGIAERDLDRVVLDLSEPWQVVPHAREALRLGGIIACYSPSIIQVQQTVAALEAGGGFGQIETIETLFRSWHVEGDAVRPDHQMVGHTAFLTFARRLEVRARGAPRDADIEVGELGAS
ncbi:MAG: tRNA (adenine-N1)-methyltransferase [Chloroflexota bacterium]